jgi:hypothetical protein
MPRSLQVTMTSPPSPQDLVVLRQRLNQFSALITPPSSYGQT